MWEMSELDAKCHECVKLFVVHDLIVFIVC
jgi:hypothetical protein